MRVSWLIPVRDGARWLHAAVASALAECGLDDEVIVCDDGSSDAPQSVLPADARVRFLEAPAAGIACALERGRAAAQGTFLARLDADDEALSGRIAAQLALIQSDERIGAVGGAVRMRPVEGIGATSMDIGARSSSGEGMLVWAVWLNSVTDPMRDLYVECPLLHPAMLLRASALAQVGGWRQGNFPEDYDLVLRLADAGWRLGTVAREVVWMRDLPSRLSRTDPRYAPERFDELKRASLAQGLLRTPRKVVLWGGKGAGKEWLRWLLAQGHTVPCVLDIGRAHARLGVPVVAPDAVRNIECDLVLVAVGRRGAREEIRARARSLRPDLEEPRTLLFVR